MFSGLIAVFKVFTLLRVRFQVQLLICYSLKQYYEQVFVLITNDRGYFIFKISRNIRDNNLFLNLETLHNFGMKVLPFFQTIKNTEYYTQLTLRE